MSSERTFYNVRNKVIIINMNKKKCGMESCILEKETRLTKDIDDRKAAVKKKLGKVLGAWQQWQPTSSLIFTPKNTSKIPMGFFL